jgi:hypothetical protein
MDLAMPVVLEDLSFREGVTSYFQTARLPFKNVPLLGVASPS